ncbi:hypothetical protein ACSBR1_028220 [Camellia fascicularis]
MPGPQATSSRKGLKICCGVTFILLIVFITVSITLFFTVFKPKQPKILTYPATLENVQFQVYPFSLNATLGLTLTIVNRNYGNFKYKNTTTYVNYHGINIAEVPMEPETVPARGKLNITTYANVTGDKLITSPDFWKDIGTGSLNFTSTSAMHGKVGMLKIFKLSATVFCYCDISVIIKTQGVESQCYSKIKL